MRTKSKVKRKVKKEMEGRKVIKERKWKSQPLLSRAKILTTALQAKFTVANAANAINAPDASNATNKTQT